MARNPETPNFGKIPSNQTSLNPPKPVHHGLPPTGTSVNCTSPPNREINIRYVCKLKEELKRENAT